MLQKENEIRFYQYICILSAFIHYDKTIIDKIKTTMANKIPNTCNFFTVK